MARRHVRKAMVTYGQKANKQDFTRNNTQYD